MNTGNDDADKAKERVIEIQSRLYDRASAYTNLMLVAGYASAFTIWNFTRDQIGAKPTILVALLLGSSLTVFIFFEVYKMALNTIYFQGVFRAMRYVNSPRMFLTEVHKAEIAAHERNLLQYKVWAFVLGFTVLTAVAALLILFWNFIVLVLPPWPTT